MLELLVSIRIISMRTIIQKQDIKKKKRIFFETPSARFMASLSEIKIMHAAGEEVVKETSHTTCPGNFSLKMNQNNKLKKIKIIVRTTRLDPYLGSKTKN